MMRMPAHFWMAMLLASTLACSKRKEEIPVPADVAAPARDGSLELDEPDCTRIARGYVPCLPFPETPAPERLQPPETPFCLPCREDGPRVDLFSDLHSPADIRILKEILEQEVSRPGTCLCLHPFGENLHLGAFVFAELAAEPRKGWEILRRHVEQKRYMALLEEYGPLPPLPERLQERLERAAENARAFGVRKTPLTLVNGRAFLPAPDGEGPAFTLPAASEPEQAKDVKASTRITWMETNPRLEELTKEFTVLCRTRQNWRPRMVVIQDCLGMQGCGAIRDCISGRLYEQDWAEMEISDPMENWPYLAQMGNGSIPLHAWLDPDCPHSRETFFILQQLVREEPVRVLIEITANAEKGIRVREILTDARWSGSESAACFLSIAFAYYDLLDAADLARIPLACGMPEFSLQSGGKKDKLPAGTLPAFCTSRITPCLYLGQHAMEGRSSLNFLKYAVSRATGKRR